MKIPLRKRVICIFLFEEFNIYWSLRLHLIKNDILPRLHITCYFLSVLRIKCTCESAMVRGRLPRCSEYGQSELRYTRCLVTVHPGFLLIAVTATLYSGPRSIRTLSHSLNGASALPSSSLFVIMERSLISDTFFIFWLQQ